jgi:hypothetical protein
MEGLFNAALARIDRAEAKHKDFGEEWAAYISTHPWTIDVVSVGDRTFEVFAVVRDPAPQVLTLVFSEWLATLRAALDNGFYAWVAHATGKNPPPKPERLQFPICTTPEDFKRQRSRFSAVPKRIVDLIEMAQPYQSPYGPKSNLLYWLNELARTDRHRELHVGLGRIAEHKVRVGLPQGESAVFDTTVKPYNFIDDRKLVARFTTSRKFDAHDLEVDLRGVGVDPEIRAWADFRLTPTSSVPPLAKRMRYTVFFMRNHVENMALRCGVTPSGGFRTIDPDEGALEA